MVELFMQIILPISLYNFKITYLKTTEHSLTEEQSLLTEWTHMTSKSTEINLKIIGVGYMVTIFFQGNPY